MFILIIFFFVFFVLDRVELKPPSAICINIRKIHPLSLSYLPRLPRVKESPKCLAVTRSELKGKSSNGHTSFDDSLRLAIHQSID